MFSQLKRDLYVMDPFGRLLAYLKKNVGNRFSSPRGDFFRRGRKPSGFLISSIDEEKEKVGLQFESGKSLEIEYEDIKCAIVLLTTRDSIRIGGADSREMKPSLEECIKEEYKMRTGKKSGHIFAPPIADLLVLSEMAEFCEMTSPSGRMVQGIRMRNGDGHSSSQKGSIEIISSVLETNLAASEPESEVRGRPKKARILITYASRYGSTAEVAHAIGAALWEEGANADVLPVSDVHHISLYSAVVIGSPLYMGRWLEDAVLFVKEHKDGLAEIPVAAFTVGFTLRGINQDGQDMMGKAYREIRPFISVEDPGYFGGCVQKDRLSIADRVIIRLARIENGDFRDWKQIRDWAKALLPRLSAS